MTAPLRAITSLGQYEDRLRAALGLVGDVGLAFSPSGFIPVIISGDARMPGTATRRGRRFAGWVYNPGTAAVNTCFKLRALEKLVIERAVVTFTNAAGNPPQLRIQPDTVADGTAVYVAWSNSAWREGRFGADGPPLQVTNGTGAPNLGRSLFITAPNQPTARWPSEVCLEAGYVLSAQCDSATDNLIVYIEGYIF